MNGVTSTGAIELTPEEQRILASLKLRPDEVKDHIEWARNGDLVVKLIGSLKERRAIPEIRVRYFTDPAYQSGRRKGSYHELFERNGTVGDEILRHPHFLKLLRYFLFGAELPAPLKKAFTERVGDLALISSSDVMPLCRFARQLARDHALAGHDVGEPFFQLALDAGLSLSYSALVRDYVKKLR